MLDDQGKFLLTNWLSDIDLDIKPDRDTGDFIKSTLYLLNIAHWTAKDVVLVRVDKVILLTYLIEKSLLFYILLLFLLNKYRQFVKYIRNFLIIVMFLVMKL